MGQHSVEFDLFTRLGAAAFHGHPRFAGAVNNRKRLAGTIWIEPICVCILWFRAGARGAGVKLKRGTKNVWWKLLSVLS